jgi:DNA-binding MurR/RpiR family transcriptional regulator
MGIQLVSARIKNGMDGLTTSEKKIARIILSEYPAAALQPVAKLAEKANVSAPTVLRFVNKLGIESYPVFQTLLLDELSERHKSAIEQYPDSLEVSPKDELLSRCLGIFSSGLQQSFQDLPSSEFHLFIELMADPKRRVHCVGGRFSATLANYLALHLQGMRADCFYIASDRYWTVNALLDMDKKDVLVVYDFRRYQQQTLDMAQKAHAQGAAILLITDRYLSPAAEFATSVLTVDIKGPSPFDSHLSAMAVTEAVVAAMAEKLGDKAKDRMIALESLGDDFEAQG